MFHNTSRILPVVALLTLAGCSTESAIRNVANGLITQPDPTVELLESELRWMEDNLYRMDNQLETCLGQLESTRRNNAALRLELATKHHGPGSVIASPTNATPVSSATKAKGSGSQEYDEETDDVEDLLNVPVIKLGDEKEPGDFGPEADKKPRFGLPGSTPKAPKSESILLPRPRGTPPSTEELPSNPFRDEEVAPPAEPNEVHRIQLNNKLTGGYSFDGNAGHDGVMVVIEPQDAYARYAPVAGPVTVELRDPNQTGVAGQVGKWTFTEVEIKRSIKTTPMGKGIHLELPWPTGSPTTRRLELDVVYQNPRGKTLTANKSVLINPTTSALTTQADAAEQGGWYSTQTPTASRWKPTR